MSAQASIFCPSACNAKIGYLEVKGQTGKFSDQTQQAENNQKNTVKHHGKNKNHVGYFVA